MKILETEGGTHTEPLGLAALPGGAGLPHEQQITEQNLNRNLKSLRNERKKNRKSKAKRAGKKDRGSEK